MGITLVSRIALAASSFGLFAMACGGDSTTLGPAGTSAGGSGAADSNTSSTAGNGGSTGSSMPECPHTGPPVLDPAGLPECPTDVCAGGAHCIPSSLVPADQLDSLADCDADNKCVPDTLIETGGNFILPTCTSVFGAEGRCLSTCVPQLADTADSLPQDICDENERCTPCFDPLQDGAPPTGACELSCDPGPVEDPVSAPKCCEGLGTCVPTSSVPADLVELLPADTCPQEDYELVCAPDTFIEDPDYTAPACETGGIFNAAGACLPDCLITGLQGFFVGQGTCEDGYSCAPCTDPITMGPTGACD